MKEILGFLRELERNNNREWFHANKPRYDEVKQRIDNLAMRLIAAVATVDPEATLLTPRDCTYRIYRDTRFSADKTPYKTHIGIFVNPPGGKKSLTCGYYLHLEPGKSFFAAGTVCLPSSVVRAIRRSIYDNVDEYRSIVEDPQFTSLFPKVGENPVKTVPQGFPKDWEYIDLIRPRDYMASSDVLPDASLDCGRLPEMLMDYIRQAHRFNRFMNYTIEDFV